MVLLSFKRFIKKVAKVCISKLFKPRKGSSIPYTSAFDFKDFSIFIRTFSPPDKVAIAWPIIKCPSKIFFALINFKIAVAVITLLTDAR